jgi:hypothetical protein
MSGHTLSIKGCKSSVAGWIEMGIVCNEHPGEALCRVECVQGCETFEFPFHEHELVPTQVCNAVEWIDNCDSLKEDYVGPDDQSLSDGIAVEVEWTGDGYTWKPAI